MCSHSGSGLDLQLQGKQQHTNDLWGCSERNNLEIFDT